MTTESAETIESAKQQLQADAEAARQRLLNSPTPKTSDGPAGLLYRKLKDAPPGQELVLVRQLQEVLHKSGYRSEEDLARERRNEELQEAYRRQDVVRRLADDCGIRKRYLGADLDDLRFIEQHCPEAVEAYRNAALRLASLVERPATVICHGKNGPGKTYQASALVKRFVALGRSARYDTADRFFLSLTSTFGEKGRTKEDVIRRYERYELLVIDEYEVRGDSKFHEQILRSLIDARYAELRSTVLITNLEIEDINERLPRSVRDRVRGSGDVIHYSWGSLRRFGEGPPADPRR